jgi:hypothetical protein
MHSPVVVLLVACVALVAGNNLTRGSQTNNTCVDGICCCQVDSSGPYPYGCKDTCECPNTAPPFHPLPRADCGLNATAGNNPLLRAGNNLTFTLYTAHGPDCAGAVVAKTGTIGPGPNAGGSCGISVKGIGDDQENAYGGSVERLGCDSLGNLISYRYGRSSDPAKRAMYLSECESGVTASYDVRLLIKSDENVCKVDIFNKTVYTKAVWACP